MSSIPVPPDISMRIALMLQRMLARGMAEPVEVWAEQSQYDASGVAIARARQRVLTFTAHYAIGGGTLTPGQEGKRASELGQLFFLPDPTGVLTEATYKTCWIVMPQRSTQFHRIDNLQVVGPYVWAQLGMGGTSDMAGNVR